MSRSICYKCGAPECCWGENCDDQDCEMPTVQELNDSCYIVNEGAFFSQYLPVEHGNITLRDYFAAAAVQGLMDSMAEPKRVAHLAYRVADAMLEEREGSGDE